MEPNTEGQRTSVGATEAATSAALPKQVREGRRPRWAWTEPSVWTERMLNRLENSEAGTVWYSLWDKVWATDNLHQAVLEVILNQGCAGVDGQTTQQLQQNWTTEVSRLQQRLREGSYRPKPALRHWIEKMGSTDKRPLGISAVIDRVVQAATRHVLEPIFERDFAEQSYGFRPGRGCQGALRRVEELLLDGSTWVVDADLKGYFDSIPQARLLTLVQTRVADGKVLGLLQMMLRAGVMERGRGWQATETGTPQGSGLSPLLANIYLNPLDHAMAGTGYEMVRYADDFVVLCRSEAEAQAALTQIQSWVAEAGLSLHPTKTRLVNAAVAGGFDFLGYHFEQYSGGRGLKWPRRKSVQKLRATIRAKTSRLRSGAMGEIILALNPTLKGWYTYFAASIPNALTSVDSWVRRRLRSIQRWRWGRKGSSRGRENVEMPNAWFTEQGLFSLEDAQARRVRSPVGTH